VIGRTDLTKLTLVDARGAGESERQASEKEFFITEMYTQQSTTLAMHPHVKKTRLIITNQHAFCRIQITD